MTTGAFAGADGVSPVLLRLRALGVPSLPDGQRERLISAGRRIETVAARTVLQHEDERVQRARYVLSGWAGRQRDLPDGRRQIFSLILPGDGMGVCPDPQPIAHATVVALTRMVLASADELATEAAHRDYPELAQAHREAEREDHRRLLDQIVRLGRQSAYERLGHLLLELSERLGAVGLASEGSFALPLTQETLADVLGLSVVHLNRTLTEMRRDRALVLDRGWVTLTDPALLASRVDYRSAARLPSPPASADGA